MLARQGDTAYGTKSPGCGVVATQHLITVFQVLVAARKNKDKRILIFAK